MKTRLTITAALAVISLNTFAKEILFTPQDTVKRDTIRIAPNLAKTDVRSFPFFGYFGKDNIAFQTYAGYNVLNALRGHVPNLNISPNPSDVSVVGGRSGMPMLVIDGLPFQNSFANNYNMNAFDYESVYMMSNGNGMALYGGFGASGGIFLQSKSGRNFFKPTLEFNSFTSMTHGSDNADDRFAFTESIAYAQDFGAVDARVSYTNMYLPPVSEPSRQTFTDQNVRVNLGADVTKNLNVRMILDRWSRGGNSRFTYSFGSPPQTQTQHSEVDRENLQGNLMIDYAPLKWLRVSSQSSLSKIGSENSSTNNGLDSDSENEYKRRFMNLFASARHEVTDDLTIHEYAGVQYERNRYYRAMTTGGWFPGFVEQSYSASTESFLMGAGVKYNTWLYLDFNHRRDKSSALPDDYGSKPSFSISSAFVFTDAFHLGSSVFSLGKLRAAFGNISSGYVNGYPNTFTVPAFGYPGSVDRDMLEVGADLTFLKRLNFTFNYYHNTDAEKIVSVPILGGGGVIFIETGAIHNKGLEVMLGGDVVSKPQFNFNTQLIWAKYDIKIDGTVFGSPEPGMSLGSSNPDWTGSLLNQLTFKNFYTSLLIDMRHGGMVYAFTDQIYDATLWKLRDVSVGYQIPSQKRLHANVSLSARNMLTLHKRAGNTGEQEGITQVNKSVSLSVTLGFR